MRVKDIQIGETYNQIQIISDLGYQKPDHRYGCKCTNCGKEFEISAKHIGKVKTCRECSEKSKIVDISGQRFGRLVALQRVGRTLAPNGTRQSMWKCRCDCGNETVVKYIALTSGNTRSCGCMEEENRHVNMQKTATQRRKSVSNSFAGKLEDHPLYKTWKSMLMRCNNPNVRDYKHYGGRGIKICDRWSSELGFENFVNDMGGRPSGTTLDRIDVNGDYCPENCRWATDEQQANNKTDNVYIIVGDRQITAKQFCKMLGLNYWTVIKQIERGLDVDLLVKFRNMDLRTKAFRRNPEYYNHNRVVLDEVIKLLEQPINNIHHGNKR